jgi:DNA-binding transcriptional regulator YiaG
MQGLEYLYQAYECEKCHAAVTTTEQQRQKIVAIADAYRVKKKLYSSKEIRKFRKKWDMSQEKFADFLGAGVASVRRWEGAGIQDLSQNEVIRLKCDEQSVIDQFIASWQNNPADEYTGYRKFNIAVLVSIFARFNSYAASPLYFFKALFYVDVWHFIHHKVSVTGLRYECLQHGPIPINYDFIRDYIKTHYAERTDTHNIYVRNIYDESLFSDSEKAAILYVENLLKEKGKEYVYKRVHKLAAFKDTDYLDPISYASIKEINI